MQIRTSVPSLHSNRTSTAYGTLAFDHEGLSGEVSEEMALHHVGMSGFHIHDATAAVQDAIDKDFSEKARAATLEAKDSSSAASASGQGELLDALRENMHLNRRIKELELEVADLKDTLRQVSEIGDPPSGDSDVDRKAERAAKARDKRAADKAASSGSDNTGPDEKEKLSNDEE